MAGEAREPADGVYRFDISRYKDGRYRLIPASAVELVRFNGRVLHHGPAPSRRSKVNTVQFDWPAVAFSIRVKKTRAVGMRLKGDGERKKFFLFCFVVLPSKKELHHDEEGGVERRDATHWTHSAPQSLT